MGHDMIAGYTEGQRVRLRPLISSHGKPDPHIQQYAGHTGTIVKSYCVTRDEISGGEKMFINQDVYCYDIRLDAGDTVLKGIPEAALEPH